MSKAFKCRYKQQSIAWALLFTMLTWMLVDNAPALDPHYQTKLLKHTPEWVIFQLGVSSEPYSNSVDKDFTYLESPVTSIQKSIHSIKLSLDCLEINNYLRNPFYALTSIHAP